jgi:uncharacterized protein (DUF433 family)
MSEHVTLRLPSDTRQRLSRRAERLGVPRATLAQRYIEEGIRADDHPLVRFVDRASGRQARLVGTRLDIWQVIETVRAHDNDVDAAAAELDKPRTLVEAAIRYYGEFTDEIDREIESNHEQFAQAHAAWQAGQHAISR